MRQNPNRTSSEHPNPHQNRKPKMGGEFTENPKKGSQNGFDHRLIGFWPLSGRLAASGPEAQRGRPAAAPPGPGSRVWPRGRRTGSRHWGRLCTHFTFYQWPKVKQTLKYTFYNWA